MTSDTFTESAMSQLLAKNLSEKNAEEIADIKKTVQKILAILEKNHLEHEAISRNIIELRKELHNE